MTTVLFIEYPKCSTCQKAKKWLDDHGITYIDRHIVENRPSAAEFEQWISLSGLPLKSFFNTSGMLYRELEVKNRLPELNHKEQLELLSSNGMLVKRPLLIGANFAVPGFKPEVWLSKLS